MAKNKNEIIGIINTAARIYHLRSVKGNHRVTVHVNPGFSTVTQATWDVVKTSEFAKRLIKDGVLKVGGDVDDLILEQKEETKTIEESTPVTPERKTFVEKVVAAE